MSNGTILIWVLLFHVVVGLSPLYIFKCIYTKERREANRVLNYDVLMCTFCYRLPMRTEDALNALRLPSVYDELKYTFDAKEQTIEFTRHFVTVRYRLHFLEYNGQQYMKVTKLAHKLDKNNLSYFINPFWIKKIGATPIPYFETTPKL